MAATFILSMFDPKDYDMWFAGGTYGDHSLANGKSLKTWCTQEKADLCFNGTWFNMPTAANKKDNIAYDTVCFMVGKGKQIGYGGVYERIAFDSRNIIGGCYVGIKDDKIVFNDTKTSTARNGIGQTTDGRYFMVQTTSMTNKACCQKTYDWVHKKYNTKIKLFILEDGGGSVGVYSSKSKLLWAPKKEGADGRYVANVICFKRRTTAPKIERVLKRGCKGDDVKVLQQTIGGVEIDGSYGPAMVTRVKQVQKALGLAQDGSCGPATLTALGLR